MKDFTKKGTKLPVIPVGTEYLTGLTERKWESHYCKKPLYSHGETLRRGEVYIKAEKKNYNENDDFYLIKLSTIERLAKEQGMCDGCIDFEFIKDWWHMLPSSKNQELRQIYFKNHIGFLGIDRLFFIYKSEINNENTKVKLQENGTVTVTDTETTTTLSKVTVDEICRLVKDKDKKPQPQLGKWYKVKNLKNGCLGFPDIGFFTDEKHTDGICGGIDGFNLKTINGRVWRVNGDFSELSPETVEQYLTDEAVKRGYKIGTKIKSISSKNECICHDEIYYNGFEFNQLLFGMMACIFENGVWSEIIQPETITRAEAEKRLGKVITD